jgi:hypothetical protein
MDLEWIWTGIHPKCWIRTQRIWIRDTAFKEMSVRFLKYLS